MSVFPFASKALAGTKAAISTAGSFCEIAAVCTAAWAICFPEKAADQWVRFEHHIEAARADLANIAASNREIVASSASTAESTATTAVNTAQTSDNTGLVARYVADMASIERGLEIYAIAEVDYEDLTRGKVDIHVGNYSTTPLNNFDYSLLDEHKKLLGSRRVHQLIQDSGASASIPFVADAGYLTKSRHVVWICASGDIGKTGTRAYFIVELEGHRSDSDFINFSVVGQEQDHKPSEMCAAAAEDH